MWNTGASPPGAQASDALASAHLKAHFLQKKLVRPGRVLELLHRQSRWGSGLGDVAVADGAITPINLAQTVASGLGMEFVDFAKNPPDQTLCKAHDLSFYLGHLVLPWKRVGETTIIACYDPSERIRRVVAAHFGPRTRLVVTGKFDILWAVQRIFHDELTRKAVFDLDDHAPHFSARRVVTKAQAVWCGGFFSVAALGLASSPALVSALLLIAISLLFVVNIVVRLVLFAAASIRRSSGYHISPEAIAALDERQLPIYSVLVPLYREAHMIESLAGALRALDYPAAKLDVKLILEEDDHETIAAVKALRLDGRFEILCVPPSFPRTKPKACNYALPFVRGEYVAIYDAEDRPDADQLKKAICAFAGAGVDVACVQARLNFYNTKQNWLTRLFALEYAVWFDFLLPGLSRLGLPIPLGGTSNHFRTDSLRAMHAWDAFNVTEDADLGIRIARQGYRVLPMDSSTYEEAVARPGAWLRQRSRWIKGYMQTSLVHLRRPDRFVAALGWFPFFGFVAFVTGAILTNLLSPLIWTLSGVMMLVGSERVLGPYGGAVLDISFFSLVAGNGLLTVLAMLAPLKRRWFSLVPYGATVFVYWLLISAAAYRAIWQLLMRPFHWEKTEHVRPRGAAG